MSADNGIYILQTPKGKGFEFRVEEMQAVENYKWDDANSRMVDEDERWEKGQRVKCEPYSKDGATQVMITNARRMWSNCKAVHTSKAAALQEAAEIEKAIMKSEFPVLEYGISFIRIDAEF